MKENEIVSAVKNQFAELEWVETENGSNYFVVPAAQIDVVSEFLKNTENLKFDFSQCISAFDVPDSHIEVTYHYFSYEHRHFLVLKVKVPRENGEVNSISHLYGSALFQEREVYDHFGVKFKGHPDLRRILLPDDWEGYPLLKDYEEQEDYNGIGTTRPSML